MKRLNEWKCKKCSVTVNTVDNSDDTEIESESHDVDNLNVVQWFNGLFHPIFTKSYNIKCNINHMREQMLDEDPAKREAWSAESSAFIYTTGTLKLHII